MSKLSLSFAKSFVICLARYKSRRLEWCEWQERERERECCCCASKTQRPGQVELLQLMLNILSHLFLARCKTALLHRKVSSSPFLAFMEANWVKMQIRPAFLVLDTKDEYCRAPCCRNLVCRYNSIVKKVLAFYVQKFIDWIRHSKNVKSHLKDFVPLKNTKSVQ